MRGKKMRRFPFVSVSPTYVSCLKSLRLLSSLGHPCAHARGGSLPCPDLAAKKAGGVSNSQRISSRFLSGWLQSVPRPGQRSEVEEKALCGSDWRQVDRAQGDPSENPFPPHAQLLPKLQCSLLFSSLALSHPQSLLSSLIFHTINLPPTPSPPA